MTAYIEIDIQKFDQLSGEDLIDSTGIKIRKENKTRKVFGKVLLLQDVGNDVLAGVRVFKRSGSGYQLLPYKLPPKPICDALNKGGYIYPEIVAMSDAPKQPVPCPLPKVRTSIKKISQ